jgi:hypothetical protein
MSSLSSADEESIHDHENENTNEDNESDSSHSDSDINLNDATTLTKHTNNLFETDEDSDVEFQRFKFSTNQFDSP